MDMGSIIQSSGINWESFIGRELGNVTLIKELGRGVMGVVFVAFQKTLKRQVAVKVLVKNRDNAQLAGELFRDEGEVVAVLSHPNIIPIFEMGEEDDCFFQVMQLVDGIDLRTTLKRLLKHPIPSKRQMPIDDVINIIVQIADALGYAHEEGVVHQDIKPANILIENRSQRPLVADFGIARALAGEYKSEGLVVGSPLYMAPEQAMGKPTDGRADIYSLGVMLFEMAAGSLPIRHDDKVDRILERKKYAPDTFFTKLPGQMSPRIDSALEKIIMRATAAMVEQRYQDCAGLVNDLRQMQKGSGT
jgi:eukaryotic-like serine/threonine-protein kinase